jgi:hypothetical protein
MKEGGLNDTRLLLICSFSNVLGTDTWLEKWQGVDADAGAPVAFMTGLQ